MGQPIYDRQAFREPNLLTAIGQPLQQMSDRMAGAGHSVVQGIGRSQLANQKIEEARRKAAIPTRGEALARDKFTESKRVGGLERASAGLQQERENRLVDEDRETEAEDREKERIDKIAFGEYMDSKSDEEIRRLNKDNAPIFFRNIWDNSETQKFMKLLEGESAQRFRFEKGIDVPYAQRAKDEAALAERRQSGRGPDAGSGGYMKNRVDTLQAEMDDLNSKDSEGAIKGWDYDQFGKGTPGTRIQTVARLLFEARKTQDKLAIGGNYPPQSQPPAPKVGEPGWSLFQRNE
jgi:hypothetical protein